MNLYLQMGSNNFNETRHNESLHLRPLPGTRIDYASYERDVAEVLTAIAKIPYRTDPEFIIRGEGSQVQYCEWRSSGRYLLGHRKVACPVRCMYVCCAQRKDTSQYYTMKILNLKNEEIEILTQDDIQGMFLMHNEYMLLNRLKDKDGVYRVHDYFKELYAEEELNANSVLIYSGRVRVRVCLVLDYVTPNDTQPECKLINLQQYVLNKKVLTELEAARIFREILLVVNILHSNNIVHRDLKLSNIRFDINTNKVTLVNFGLGQYLPSINTMITDQRGSPAYISPDILTAKPYAPKPSDMWSLGVSFYVMIMGTFPFYDIKSKQLFDKVHNGSYMIPLSGIDRLETIELIQGLLTYNPEARIKIDEAIVLTTQIINALSTIKDEPMQIVPDLESSEDVKLKDSEEYRWKFSALERGNRVTLKQEPRSQVPILHLSADEQRVKAIEMKHIRSCIIPANNDENSSTIQSSGIFNGNPTIAKPEPVKIDQVVPEVEIDDTEIESFTKVPQNKPKVKPKRKKEPSSPPQVKRLLRSNVCLKNINIRSLLK